MDELEKNHFKRRIYEHRSIYDLPNEVILESIFPYLYDIDVHNLGEACKTRIKQLADYQIPLGSRNLEINPNIILI